MMKKRLTAVFAVLCLLCSMAVLPVSAAGTAVALSFDTAYSMAGDTVTLTLSVSDNHYMTCGQFALRYDPAQLALKPIEDDVYIEPDAAITSDAAWEFGVPAEGECYFVFASLSSVGVSTGGELFTLTFDVLDGFDGDEEITLTVDELIANDGETKKGKDYEPEFTVQNGKVLTRPKGDVDASGLVEIGDAVMLFRYVAGRMTLTEQQLRGGNVTGTDSEVNIFDVMAVYQYVNGKINSL